MTATLSPTAARRTFYVLTMTRWFPVGFVVGIFVLLATSRGLTIAQTLTYGAVSGYVCFALELPTSGFADAFGRRPVFVFAAALGVLTALAYVIAHSFWAFVVASALMGVFRAVDSGTLEAWFVDAIHESAPGQDVDQEMSRQGTFLGLAIAVGALLSGGLIWWHPLRDQPPLDLVVWCFLAGNVVHLAASLALLKETPRHRSGSSWWAARESMRQAPAVVRSGIRLLRGSRVLVGLLLAETAWSASMIAFESLMPLRLEELVGSAQHAGALVGPAAALGWAIFSGGTWIAGRASSRFGVARAAMLGRGLNGIGILLMGAALSPAGLLAAYFFTYAAHGLNGPPHNALLHREARAENRATVLSMNSMVGFLAFGVGAPLAGYAAEHTSLTLTIAGLGIVGLIGVVAYRPARTAERAHAA